MNLNENVRRAVQNYQRETDCVPVVVDVPVVVVEAIREHGHTDDVQGLLIASLLGNSAVQELGRRDQNVRRALSIYSDCLCAAIRRELARRTRDGGGSC